MYLSRTRTGAPIRRSWHRSAGVGFVCLPSPACGCATEGKEGGTERGPCEHDDLVCCRVVGSAPDDGSRERLALLPGSFVAHPHSVVLWLIDRNLP